MFICVEVVLYSKIEKENREGRGLWLWAVAFEGRQELPWYVMVRVNVVVVLVN